MDSGGLELVPGPMGRLMIELDEFAGRPPMDGESLVRTVLQILRREPATAARESGAVEKAVREVCNAGIGARPGSVASFQVREALNGALLRLAGASLTAIQSELSRRNDDASQKLLSDALIARYRNSGAQTLRPPEAQTLRHPDIRPPTDAISGQAPDATFDRREVGPTTRPGRPRADDSIAGTLDEVRRRAREAAAPAAVASSGQILHRFVLADGVEVIVHDRRWQEIVRAGHAVEFVRAVREAATDPAWDADGAGDE
jgi:hypothetical protein